MSISGPCPSRLRALLASLLLLLFAVPASAAEEAPPNVTWEREWQVTAAGRAAGVERVKVVESASGTRFASGEVVPPGKKAVRVVVHHQRDAAGLHKYRRVRDERQGRGLFAFRKGELIRIVGVNDGAKAAELGSPQLLLWDPAALHSLESWTRRLARLTAATELPFVVSAPRQHILRALASQFQAQQAVLHPESNPFYNLFSVKWILDGSVRIVSRTIAYLAILI